MKEARSVLYRKYRPKKFSEIVGEDHITSALEKAVEHNSVAHAYLFTGPRGTGKTTAARILARAVNCEKSAKQAPCNSCATCIEFLEGRAIDLIEIDAASNRGIDEIRDLREAVRFSPLRSKRKVYIIDEVHMLTREAFNALLKTLEEPPEFVLFILATTDPDKVPDTIRSRVEEFQFRRIPVHVLEKRLLTIAKAEGVTIDTEVPRLVALLAEGSARDAESMFGQVISGTDGKVSAQRVTELFGLPEAAQVARMMLALTQHDRKSAFDIVQYAVEHNIDTKWFVKLLIEDFRYALMLTVDQQFRKVLADDFSEEHIKFLEQIAGLVKPEKIRTVLLALLEAYHSQYTDVIPQLPFELAIVQITEVSENTPS